VYAGGLSALALAALCATAACERPVAEGEAIAPVALAAHTAEFEKAVIEVTDGVHQAVGFGLANSILVEGDDCVFIVDVMASVETARAVKAEFDKITDKPIRALVYTHNHADHVFGGRGFVPEGDVDVYAHETTESYIDRVVSIIRPIISTRSERMFGNQLPAEGPDAFVNAGIGRFLEIGRGGDTLGLIRPNRSFADQLDIELCGVQVRLVHAPGETNDQLFVWLPEKRLLMPGDNVYKAFPNLYTIRGTLYRDVLEWVKSIDRMRDLRPEHLAPSHTRPVSGADRIGRTSSSGASGCPRTCETIRTCRSSTEPSNGPCARSSAATSAGSAATPPRCRRRVPASAPAASRSWPVAKRLSSRRRSGRSSASSTPGRPNWRATWSGSTRAPSRRSDSRPPRCGRWGIATRVPTDATTT
jgi:glyoxylase-like metal-dependent hydrolase (beta-lactamase superfamily II)